MKKILIVISLALLHVSSASAVTLYDALNQTYIKSLLNHLKVNQKINFFIQMKMKVLKLQNLLMHAKHLLKEKDGLDYDKCCIIWFG